MRKYYLWIGLNRSGANVVVVYSRRLVSETSWLDSGLFLSSSRGFVWRWSSRDSLFRLPWCFCVTACLFFLQVTSLCEIVLGWLSDRRNLAYWNYVVNLAAESPFFWLCLQVFIGRDFCLRVCWERRETGFGWDRTCFSVPGLMQMKLTAGFGLTPFLDWDKLGYGQRNIKTRSH